LVLTSKLDTLERKWR